MKKRLINKKTMKFVSMLPLLTIALLGIGSTSSLAQETVKIGFNVPLTGFAAADGTSARHGAELAV